jgi:hypothetical protein
MTAARQSLINWHNALVALIVRLPLRLLPSGLLRQVMFIFTRLPQAKKTNKLIVCLLNLG